MNLTFIAMTLWLLNLSIARLPDLLVDRLFGDRCGSEQIRRPHSAFLTVLIPPFFCLYLILALEFNINAELAEPKFGKPF